MAPICASCKIVPQDHRQAKHQCGTLLIMLGMQNGATLPPDCALSLMLDLAHWDWLIQDQHGRG